MAIKSPLPIFDFDLHLITKATDTQGNISSIHSMLPEQLLTAFEAQYPDFQRYQIQAANFMLFNSNVAPVDYTSLIQIIQTRMPGSLFTWLVDFRQPNIIERIDQALAVGIKSFLLQPYHVKISKADYPELISICQHIEAHQGMICLGTSYGTSRLYDYDTLALVAFITSFIKKAPLVLIHAGGARLLEAQLIADMNPNVYLETSFAFSYYQGSSLIQDYAFVFRKLGTERILFGTDLPFMPAAQAIQDMSNFFDQYQFSDSDREKIFSHNAPQLLAQIL